MSDEPEARMWDEESSQYGNHSRGAFFESAFASSEHLDRAPLLSDETYTDVPVAPAAAEAHCHWRPPAEPPSAVPQLCIALGLCAVFMVCELIGGYIAGSLSVMCDAAHMLSDCGGFALALLAFHCAKRNPDKYMSYGYKRAEVLGAMVSVLLIWALTAVFVYVAWVRVRSGEYNVRPDVMLAVSGAGVAFNVVLACVLHSCAADIGVGSRAVGEYSVRPDVMLAVSGAGVAFNVVLACVLHSCAADIAHHHSHGGSGDHSHAHAHSEPRRFRLFGRDQHKNGVINGDYSMKDLPEAETSVVENKTRNINLRAALIHVIGDLIQSCGVLLASILIKFYPDAKIVDPICTFVFSFLVLLTSVGVVRDALSMLMQGVPKNFRYRELVTSLSALSGVRHVHSVHVWSLATHHTVLTAHIAIDELTDPEAVLQSCQQLARSEFPVNSATFQVERFSPEMMRCGDCHTPGTAA